MSGHANSHPENGAHIMPISLYVNTLLGLTALMVLTIWASQMHITNLVVANAIAIAIAVFKAGLVVRNFMGVGHSTPLVKWWAILGFSWLTVLGLVLLDYGVRQYEPVAGFDPNDKMGMSLQRNEGTKMEMTPSKINVRPRNPSY